MLFDGHSAHDMIANMQVKLEVGITQVASHIDFSCCLLRSQDNLIEVGRADHPRYKDLVSWIPRMETQGLAEARIRVRRRDWDAAVDELNRALLEPDTMEQFLAKKRALSDRLATTSKVCTRSTVDVRY